MRRFFLHMKRGANLVRDLEGSLFPNPEDAHAEAILAAREICAAAIRDGEDISLDAIVVADEAGQQVRFVPVTEILPGRLRSPKSAVAGDGVAKNPGVVANLSEKYEKTCQEMQRMKRVRAEIDQHAQSCRQTISDIRQQLAAI
jgi:hypothetical protein